MQTLNDLFEGTGGRLRKIAAGQFTSMSVTDHDDLVNGAVEIALRRGLMDKPLSNRSAKNLLIDAYRELFKKSYTVSYPVDPGQLWTLAEPPNQWTDMEIRNRILSPEEQEFQNHLDEDKQFNVAREVETRFFCNSLPLLASELVEMCEK